MSPDPIFTLGDRLAKARESAGILQLDLADRAAADLPSSSRAIDEADAVFMTGGDQTVRGYPFGSLGVPRNDAIVGGNERILVVEDDAGVSLQVAGDWLAPWEVQHPSA